MTVAGRPIAELCALPISELATELPALALTGADITEELAASGELAAMLERKLGADYRDGAEEHVVDVLSGARA